MVIFIFTFSSIQDLCLCVWYLLSPCLHLWLCCSVLFFKKKPFLCIKCRSTNGQCPEINHRNQVNSRKHTRMYLIAFGIHPGHHYLCLFPGEGTVSCRQPIASQVYWFPLIHVDILSSTAGFGILSESLESVHCGCRGEP